MHFSRLFLERSARAVPLVLGEGEVHLGGLVVVLEWDGVAGGCQSGTIKEAVGDCGVAEEIEKQRPPLVDHPETAGHSQPRSQISLLVSCSAASLHPLTLHRRHRCKQQLRLVHAGVCEEKSRESVPDLKLVFPEVR